MLKCCTQYTSKVGKLNSVHKGLFSFPSQRTTMAKNVQTTERLLLNDKTPGFLASGGDEFNPGPETRLDRSELLCNKVLLSIKELEKASDIGKEGGRKSTDLLVFSCKLYSHSQSVNEKKGMS